MKVSTKISVACFSGAALSAAAFAPSRSSVPSTALNFFKVCRVHCSSYFIEYCSTLFNLLGRIRS
ncbi:hypothetical protein ACHAWO_013231 [Cyclotella atomus]|uniref:Secreted protein n=1 Tax=Cyclotella atomus TaxID=382360 RepID=A0ABD3QKK8_9STRA